MKQWCHHAIQWSHHENFVSQCMLAPWSFRKHHQVLCLQYSPTPEISKLGASYGRSLFSQGPQKRNHLAVLCKTLASSVFRSFFILVLTEALPRYKRWPEAYECNGLSFIPLYCAILVRSKLLEFAIHVPVLLNGLIVRELHMFQCMRRICNLLKDLFVSFSFKCNQTNPSDLVVNSSQLA